jgi:hypothetical protein
VADDTTHHTTAALCSFTRTRLYRVEIALRAAVTLSPDHDTALHLADLTIKVQQRRHAHEERCPLCQGAGR